MNTKRGRPKGYSPYTEISYEELADWVGRKTKVPVSKKWLQSLMGTESEEVDESSETTSDESSEESTTATDTEKSSTEESSDEIKVIEARNKPTKLPPDPLLSLGVKTRLIYERIKARSEV